MTKKNRNKKNPTLRTGDSMLKDIDKVTEELSSITKNFNMMNDEEFENTDSNKLKDMIQKLGDTTKIISDTTAPLLNDKNNNMLAMLHSMLGQVSETLDESMKEQNNENTDDKEKLQKDFDNFGKDIESNLGSVFGELMETLNARKTNVTFNNQDGSTYNFTIEDIKDQLFSVVLYHFLSDVEKSDNPNAPFVFYSKRNPDSKTEELEEKAKNTLFQDNEAYFKFLNSFNEKLK